MLYYRRDILKNRSRRLIAITTLCKSEKTVEYVSSFMARNLILINVVLCKFDHTITFYFRQRGRPVETSCVQEIFQPSKHFCVDSFYEVRTDRRIWSSQCKTKNKLELLVIKPNLQTNCMFAIGLCVLSALSYIFILGSQCTILYSCVAVQTLYVVHDELLWRAYSTRTLRRAVWWQWTAASTSPTHTRKSDDVTLFNHYCNGHDAVVTNKQQIGMQTCALNVYSWTYVWN